MTWLIRDALAQAQQRGLPRLDAQWLLAHVLQTARRDAATAAALPAGGMAPAPEAIRRDWLLAHDDLALSARQADLWAQLLDRRAAGEPLAYITGEQFFCGLRLQVTPAVLIPRPETEGLVRWAVACLQAAPTPRPRVLDMGTGSGAIALAIQQHCPQAQVWATDISPAALAVARANAQRLQLDVAFCQADWWAQTPTPDGAPADWHHPFELIVSNPPYIAPDDQHLGALRHEPALALVGANDGMGDLRRIIHGSMQHLAPGGWLLLEHGHDQADALHRALQQAGFQQPQTRADLAGLPRCTGARKPG